MFIPAFSVLFIALIGVCGTFVLCLLPIFPKSVLAKAIWLGFLTLMAWIFVTELMIPEAFGSWRTPPRSIFVQGLIFFSPFAVSLGLWGRNRNQSRPPMEERAIFGLVAIACAVSFFGLQAFNQRCLSVETDQASEPGWCSSAWQVQPR